MTRETWAHGAEPEPGSPAGNTAVPSAPAAATEPAGEAGETDAPVEARYRLGRGLGSGGMGEVFAAEDRELRREIAVKVLRRTGPFARDRFLAEAQVTAQLEHPNIVPVHDLGTLDDGRPFLAMKQVRGASLREWLTSPPPPGLEARLDVLRRVCDAMAFAHAQGVLHRDLKPENVMVGAFGEVLVMDWGLARLIAAPEGAPAAPLHVDRFDHGAMRTVDGGVAGTPAYMPPEQASGRLAELDARSDVYALGALLYELLTGRPPFEGPTDQVLAAVVAGRLVPPRRVAPEVPRELEAVVLRAMSLRKEDRYPSAEALREDLDAFIARRPLRHVRSSFGERVAKWAARHRGAVRTGLGVAVAAGAALLVGAWRYSVDVGDARDQALLEADRARAAESEARTGLGRAQLALADALAAERRFGEARAALALAAEALPTTAPEARATRLALDVIAADSPLPLSTCKPHGSASVLTIALDDAGTRAASWGGDGRLVEWDPVDCRTLSERAPGGAAGPGALRFAAGKLEALVVAGDQLHRLDQLAATPIPLPGRLHAVGFGSSGQPWLVTAEGEGFVLGDGGLVAAGGPQADGGLWRPDGELRVATSIRSGGELGGAWRADGRPLWTSAGVAWADATADGSALLVASTAGARVVDLRSGQQRWEVATGPLARLGVAPGESFVWTAGYDGAIDVLDLETGAAVVRLDAGGGRSATVVATSWDARVISVDSGNGVATWLRPLRPLRRLAAGLAGGAQGLAVSPDGRLVAAADEVGRVVLLDLATGTQLRTWKLTEGVRSLAFAPDGLSLAAAPRGDALVILNLLSGAPRRVELPWRASAVAWPSADRVWVASRTGQLAAWSPGTGALSPSIAAVPGAVWQLSPLPDGRLLVASHGAPDENPVRLLDGATGTLVDLLSGITSRYRHAVSPDGDLAALAQQDGLVPIVELATGKVTTTLHADDGPTLGVAFAPDGRTLATTGFGGRVVMWDLPSATRLRDLDQHGGVGANVGFAPDGRALLSVGDSPHVGVLHLDLTERLAAARAALQGGKGGRAEAFATLGWWERVATERDASPRLRAQASLALGEGVPATDTDDPWLRVVAAAKPAAP